MRIGRFDASISHDRDCLSCYICGSTSMRNQFDFFSGRHWWGWSLGFSTQKCCKECEADFEVFCLYISLENSSGVKWRKEVIEPILKPKTVLF